ncbi:hypothetical protein F5Y16DRAFT_377400 [Xylariaceae sp. FL0255]|nr:hypothetical protein F5Y16DRAFT_377400 [Xylariaceae sp. FL0255]
MTPPLGNPPSDDEDFSDAGDSDGMDDPAAAIQPTPMSMPDNNGLTFSTIGITDIIRGDNVNRNDYSDEDITLIYDIVVRAEAILVDDLTPDSRLPTHALFLAYDEIIAQHGLDPNERHISKLVFMVGGVKGDGSLMDKFKAVMAKMNITIAIDEELPEPEQPEDVDHGYSGDEEAVDITDIIRPERPTHIDGGYSDDEDILDVTDVVEPLPHIHNDVMEVDPIDEGYILDSPSTYSKQTERIAARAHEILSSKKALSAWRSLAREKSQKLQEAQLLAQKQAEQDREDEAFEENPYLARLAQKTYENLAMSKAFTTWANRVEEESEKAEMAKKAYEMSLKAKIFGMNRKQAALDVMRAALAKKSLAQPDQGQPPQDQPIITQTQTVQPQAQPSFPYAQRPQLSLQPPQPQGQPPLPQTQPQAPIPQTQSLQPSHQPPQLQAQVPAFQKNLDMKPQPATDPHDYDDALDEKTQLARRHILRMRYFEPWEKFTSENVAKVKAFKKEKENEVLLDAMPAWRDQANLRQQQLADNIIKHKEATDYQRVAHALPQWREKACQRARHESEVLEYYAERADYYQKTMRAIPVLRQKSAEAEQRDQLLNYYANRAYYYVRTTKAISVWREKAQEAAKKCELQDYYGERADYYYKTTSTINEWRHLAKLRRKERLKEAHLETRRMVKKGMGERCIRGWREKLEPKYQRCEILKAKLEEALAEREWRQASTALQIWRRRARERAASAAMGEANLQLRAIDQWRDRTTLHLDLQAAAEEHWETKVKSRAVRNWNLSAVQSSNRPEMVANALEKKDRRLLRHGFETWYSRTADKLVPVELSDGTYRNVNQVVGDTHQHATGNRARGLLRSWRAATANNAASNAASIAVNNKAKQMNEEVYLATPGRPRLFGSLGSRETTTPLAPVPSRSQSRRNNLRVSWAN